MEKTGLTALHILAEAGKSSDLERLAKKARTLNLFLTSSHDLPGATPLLLAAYHGNHISGADPDCRLDRKFDAITPLHHAATTGDIKAIERLLQYNASIDIQDVRENTPLVKAVLANQFEAAALLVKSGADLEVPSSHYENDTALGRAADAGSLRMVHLLCQSGANWRHQKSNPSKTENHSPFLQAVCRGHLHCAIYLLAVMGGDVNQVEDEGWRPLHYAAWHGHTEVVRWLLSMGADRTARSVKGETAEALARHQGMHSRVFDDILVLLTSTST
ncbi:protein kinase [Apiospora arundinis]